MIDRYRDPAFRDQRLDDHDQRKTRLRTKSRIPEMAHFLQITIARKARPFLKKTTQFFLITNCRNGSVSENYDRKKNYTISPHHELQKCMEMGHFLQITMARKTRPFLRKKHTISPDRELQKWATFCKLRL